MPKNEELNDEIEPISDKKEQAPKTNKSKRIRLVKLAAFLLIFFTTVIAVFSSQVVVSEQSSSSWLSRLPIIKQIKYLAESADRTLKNENEDRINVLLLGMGGKNHDGGYLTDTIILASIEPSTKKVSLISIPRDMAVPVENMGWQKINSINAYAESENPGSGGLAISQAISDLFDLPIAYYVRVDFEGFTNIVDKLGGLQIEVDNTFDDYHYPVLGREDDPNYDARYEHLHFDKGPQTMDGSTALKYARSRHGTGGEGSDFARAKRQQKIIFAAKSQALQFENLLKPSMLSGIISDFRDHINTNLKIWEIIKFWEMLKDVQKENIVNKVIDNSPNGLLMDTVSEQGAYILIPKSGDFNEIKYYINNVFSDAPVESKTEVSNERATIEVRNGTWINGLASKMALDLEKYGFIVVRIGNSSKQNFQKTVIYDLTYGEKAKSLAILKEKTGANVSLGLPDWLVEEIGGDVNAEKDPVQPDFVLVIGQDADTTESGAENTENVQEL
jgi:LCP family protein required for cell wall assembly